MSKGNQPNQGGRRSKRAKAGENVVVAEWVAPTYTTGRTRRYNAPSAAQASRAVEHKTFDYNPTGAPVVMTSDNDAVPATTPFAPAATFSGGCINQVPLGNSSITRTGRKLSITAVAIRGRIYWPVAAIASSISSKVSLLLIWDRNVNQSAALPAWNTILNAQNSISLTNKDNAPRFKILRRWDFIITNGASSNNDSSMVSVDEFVKMKNKITYFTTADTTGLYPNMQEGGLLLYFTSDTATGAACPLGEFNTRVYFQDA